MTTILISDWQVGNLLQIRIWAGSGHDSSPYMYALHFCYGLGALLTPVLAKPFLRPSLNTTLGAGAGAGLGAGHGGQDQDRFQHNLIRPANIENLKVRAGNEGPQSFNSSQRWPTPC